ncbi:MAG TPA: ferritin-like domain-containing protein [Gemmatimonadaceae bacterium]|nr:ferritin-like domain-containing protein [Gemmatimonadaceae bacterium]
MPILPPAPPGVRVVSPVAADAVDSLRLALLVAYLQSELYSRALATAGFVVAADATVFGTLSAQETNHVTSLAGLITARLGQVPARPTFDFTAKGALPGFAFAANQYETFLMLAQAFEDLSVRAYKGQVQALVADKTALNAALAIHAVEARHAAEVRRIRGKKGWVTGSSREDLPAFLQPVYDGEELTTQGTVDVVAGVGSFGGAETASQAFDEPLTTAQVTAIITPFIT